jgi:hypothetical protein
MMAGKIQVSGKSGVQLVEGEGQFWRDTMKQVGQLPRKVSRLVIGHTRCSMVSIVCDRANYRHANAVLRLEVRLWLLFVWLCTNRAYTSLYIQNQFKTNQGFDNHCYSRMLQIT